MREHATGARLAGRAALIAWLCAKQGLRLAAGWLWLLVTFSGRARRRAWFASVALDLFRELGATFIKLGQILSTRPDLIPEHLARSLERLQDDVGPFAFEDVRRTLEEDLGRPVSQLFAELAPIPIASASVAQVHKARLPDGRLVAVKVRRPNVVSLCRFDLEVMRFGGRLLGLVPSLSALAPEEAVEELARGIFAQLDFRIELRNSRRFRASFREHPDVLFPEVVEDLSSERILTMAFVEGRKILGEEARARRAPAAGSNEGRRLARIGLAVLMKMIFEDGFVHADLHPGNILVTPEGRLALLDLGLVGELDEAQRRRFARFFAAWARRDGDGMARLMFQLHAGGAGSDTDAFERTRASVIELVGRYWGLRVGQVPVGKVLLEMLAILRRHRIRVDPTFTLVNIAIAVTEGIGKQLDPGLDLMAESLPWFLAHPTGGARAG